MQSFNLEYRCICGSLLFKGLFFNQRAEIKCKHCGRFIEFVDRARGNFKDHYAMVFNKQGDIVDTSESAGVIHGTTREELLKKTIFDIAPHITKDAYERVWRKLFELAPQPLTMEVSQNNAKGEAMALRVKLSVHVINGQPNVLGIYEKIKTEEAADAQAEGGPVVRTLVAEVTPEGDYVRASNDFAHELEYGRSELVGTSMFDVFLPDQVANLKYQFDRSAKKQQSFYFPALSLVGKHGKPASYRAEFIALFRSDNQLQGYAVIYQRND